MPVLNNFKKSIFICIALFTFSVWFADGYFQWVNSDTAGDAYAIAQDINFPQALVSHNSYHSRITATILAYIPFHTVGYLFRELTGDPVTALYISQGVMTGIIFLLLVMISAKYVSNGAPILSSRYLVSAALLMLFAMSLPILPLNAPLSLSLRYGHQSVMCHYVGTMVIALFALFPFWRYIFSKKGDDWHDDAERRLIFYTLIIAAVFSSTATMIWLTTFASVTFLAIIYYATKKSKRSLNIKITIRSILNNSLIYPLMLIIILFIIGILAESITARGGSAFANTNLFGYVKVYARFFISNSTILYIIIHMLLFSFIFWQYKKGAMSSQLLVLTKIFPWLVLGNLIFIFIIGMPRVPYRFSGYNLGPDTVFPATWSMSLWLISVLLELWRKNKFTFLFSILLFILIANSLTFFSFPSGWYEMRQRQKDIFSALHRDNTSLPMDVTLPITVENVAFDEDSLKKYTMPMLRDIGIISFKREVSVVSQDIYESWHKALAADKKLPLLKQYDASAGEIIDLLEENYPNFLADVSGMSRREDWGRWTDANIAPTAKILFKQALPKKFTLEFKASAFGPNIGVPIKIRVGKIEKEFTVTKRNAEVFRLNFDGVRNADTIEIIPPKPTSPLELDSSNDARKLGVGLVYLKILK